MINMVVCVSPFPRIDEVMVYIRIVKQRFTYINILNINYSYISAYAIIIKTNEIDFQ